MTTELLLAFTTFAFVSAITPGPNNVMVLASGVNFGFVRTIPHILGIALGMVVMVSAVGLGLGGLFRALPALADVLRYVGAAFLLYLAWRIARSAGPVTDGSSQRPLGFVGAAAFQWVNPKAWVMVFGAVTAYAPRDGYMRNVLVVAVVFGLVVIPSVSVWAAFGMAMRRFLASPWRLKVFNVAMAALLVVSIYPILAGDLDRGST